MLSLDEVKNAPRAYLLHDGILVRQWVPHGEVLVGDPIFQVVVPSKLPRHVLKLAHEESGHLGFQKTYDRILHHIFWPWLKRMFL